MNTLNTFLTDSSFNHVQTLWVDCDGVLYDTAMCSSRTIKVGLDKTLDFYKIPKDEFEKTRADLKKAEVRGLFNSVLFLCNKYGVPFDEFTKLMVTNIDYSQIPADPEMLVALKQTATALPVTILTNNTRPHLEKIFDCLRGKPSTISLEKEMGIRVITIENTMAYNEQLARNIFYPKQMPNQLARLCAKLGLNPKQVGLLDDTERIRGKAQKQGLQPIPTTGPADTKQALKTLYNQSTLRRTLHGKNNTSIR